LTRNDTLVISHERRLLRAREVRMTRRIGVWIVPLLLGYALPGCALRSQNNESHVLTKEHELPRVGSMPPPHSGLFVQEPAPSVEVPPPAAGFAPMPIQRTSQQEEVHEKQKPQPAPLPLIQVPSEGKPSSDAGTMHVPAVKAFELMLHNRHPDAVEQLKAYDPQTQDFFLRMLPVMCVLVKTPFGQLPHEQASHISDQLARVQAELRPMTGVTLGTVCFCEWVKAFGNYHPLPEDYVFAAGAGAKAGELVQLYVELKHFSSIQRAKDRYETVLASSLEIRNAQGRIVRSLEFGDEKTPLVSRTPLTDYFKNYTFAMPELPPGAYTLKVVVRDETNRTAPKSAEKSLDIRIGPPR
jgi:hypothetical protein